jgi:hypothetical protein
MSVAVAGSEQTSQPPAAVAAAAAAASGRQQQPSRPAAARRAQLLLSLRRPCRRLQPLLVQAAAAAAAWAAAAAARQLHAGRAHGTQHGVSTRWVAVPATGALRGRVLPARIAAAANACRPCAAAAAVPAAGCAAGRRRGRVALAAAVRGDARKPCLRKRRSDKEAAAERKDDTQGEIADLAGRGNEDEAGMA